MAAKQPGFGSRSREPIRVLSVRQPWAWAIVATGVASILLLNFGFFAFLARRKGVLFAAGALPLHMIYYCCCGLSVVIAEGTTARLLS